MAPDLEIDVTGKPAGDVVGQLGAKGGSVPWSKQGLCEPLGWLGDVVRRKMNVVNWSRRGVPVTPSTRWVRSQSLREGKSVLPS